jgi:hypothetical protein
MRRRVQPIPAACPLHLVVALVRPGQTIGLWVAAARPRRSAVYRSARLLISADLGALLARVERVVAWDGAGLRILPVGARRAG